MAKKRNNFATLNNAGRYGTGSGTRDIGDFWISPANAVPPSPAPPAPSRPFPSPLPSPLPSVLPVSSDLAPITKLVCCPCRYSRLRTHACTIHQCYLYNAISHPIEDAFFQNTPKLKTYPRFRLAFRLRPFVPALNTPGRRYTDVFARPGSAPYTRTECTLHMRT